MNQYLKSNEWSIIEEGFDPKRQKASESIFSLGNGHMGQRANFEEKYTGQTLRGSYVAGIYYPDKTRVGWWKNGYPEYFAKVLNSPNWIGIDVDVDGEQLDLAKCKTEDFLRVLNMKEGVLSRSFVATLVNGRKIKIESQRFLSMANPVIGVIKYSVTALTEKIELTLSPYLDGDVTNEDANYNEKFWNILETESGSFSGFLLAQTRKLDFQVGFAMRYACEKNGQELIPTPSSTKTADYAGNSVKVELKQNEVLTLYKFVAVLTSLDYSRSDLKTKAYEKAEEACQMGFDPLFSAHTNRWAGIWSRSDIVIQGDVEAQQGIRFNIFQLNQTYTGEDERLNIGPKGFTGEKYGGSTYWDTEAYCIPFFIATAPSWITRNLLIYRYKHLEKAIENGKKLGFSAGAALYPMVTMNGEECHNEWEITFEEIHRNGAIAFAIFNYIRHTGDENYLADYGLEVLIAIARFWSQRATFSQEKRKYVLLGVTGPNEYENNINNNWYTNTIACWCLEYAWTAARKVRAAEPIRYSEVVAKTKFDEKNEVKHWFDIIDNMHYPEDEKTRLFLQQDGYMDKEQTLAKDLDPSQRPINKHWSWDRILRSSCIKQADTLQGIYLFEDRYDTEFIRRHFEFYEPRTVHESSLSPCIHAILASRIGNMEKAHELYLRTSRLDLDDYNHEVDEGLHITSMAGTWMAIVEGFGGKRVCNGKLFLNPRIPEKWRGYSFSILWKNCPLQVGVTKQGVNLLYQGREPMVVNVNSGDLNLFAGQAVHIPFPL